jgi:protein CpxP
MNRKPLYLATALLLATSATPALAAPFGDHPLAADRVDAHLERMTERLDLSADQQAQIRTILEDARARRDLDRQQTRGEIDTVLTDAQRAARDQRSADRMERRLQRMADRLDLSTAQQDQLRTLMAERRDNPDLTRAEMQSRMAGILDEDQLARLEDLRGGRGARDGSGSACRPGDQRGW